MAKRRRKYSDRLAAFLDNMVDEAVAEGTLPLVLAVALTEAGHQLMHAGKTDEACVFLAVACNYMVTGLVEEDEEDAFIAATKRLAEVLLDPRSAEGSAVIAAVRHTHEDLSVVGGEYEDVPTYH